MKKNLIQCMIVMLFLLCSITVFRSDIHAETVGKGARIIEYGVPEEPRFHMGAQVGTTVKLTAEPTGNKTLSNIEFTSSDTTVCSVSDQGSYWLVTRLCEGTAVIRMSCLADGDEVVRTLLMSNLTFIEDEIIDEDEDDGIVHGVLRTNATVYMGCSDVEGITSDDTEIKDTVKKDIEVEVVAKCGDYYRVETEEESTFGDSDEIWGYAKKASVYIPVRHVVAKESLTIFEQDRVTLGALVYPVVATNTDLDYTISNTNVATISDGGVITAIHRGRTVVTVTSADDDSVVVKCSLIVQSYTPVTGITIDPETLEIDDGTTGRITAYVLPLDATETSFTWSVSGEDVLKLDSKGRYETLKPGTATVTVTSKEGGYKASCQVIVRSVEAKGVYIQDTLSMDVGEVRTPVWRMIPTNATNNSVTWMSDNLDVAMVDKAGKITAIKIGTANITVKTKEGNYVDVCRVTVENYVDDINLEDTSFTMKLNTSKILKANITPAGYTKEKIVWRSADPDICTVNQTGSRTGSITTVGLGTAKILVYDGYKGAFDYALVHVKAKLDKPKLTGKKKNKKYILSWKKVKNATGYEIYEKKNNAYKKIKTTGKGKKKYKAKNPTKGIKYRICAICESNGKKESSRYSDVVSVK